MQLSKLFLSSLFCCAIGLATSGSTNKCWQVPDTNCNQDSQISSWFPQPVSISRNKKIIRHCTKMHTCSNSTHFSSKKECEEKCVLKCPVPISNPPYQPNTVIIDKELRGGNGLTYSSLSTCGKGFILIGSARRRCNANGNWTGEEPICYEIIISVSVRRHNQNEHKYKLDSTNVLKVEEGHQLLITCTIKETISVDHVVWRKVGQTTHKLPPMHDMREGKDVTNNQIYIQIDQASSVHSGTYSCKSDSIPNLSRNFTLQVKDPKKSPKIISASIKLDRKAIQLKCYAKGKPAPEVNWFKDGVLVKGKNNTISAEDTLLVITLENPSCKHIGKYACRATNEHGTIEHAVKSITAEDLGLSNAGSGSGDGCRETCLLCPHSKAPVMKTCSVSDTVIIAQLIVNETSVSSNIFMINESKVLKGSNSSHLNSLKLTEGASACGCLTLKPHLWYICTGTRNEDMLIVSENDMVYVAPDHYEEKVEKHCKLMK